MADDDAYLGRGRSLRGGGGGDGVLVDGEGPLPSRVGRRPPDDVRLHAAAGRRVEHPLLEMHGNRGRRRLHATPHGPTLGVPRTPVSGCDGFRSSTVRRRRARRQFPNRVRIAAAPTGVPAVRRGTALSDAFAVLRQRQQAHYGEGTARHDGGTGQGRRRRMRRRRRRRRRHGRRRTRTRGCSVAGGRRRPDRGGD